MAMTFHERHHDAYCNLSKRFVSIIDIFKKEP